MKKRFVLCCFLVGLAFSSSFGQSTVFIVRHAEKADGSKDAELSEAGRARAEVLANMLKDSKISAIYATEFKRTQQTAAPLAKALGLTVTILPAENQAALVAKLRTSIGASLVVGHGNTIPNIIKALGITEPVNIPDTDYDNLFVVVPGEKPHLIRLHYR
ncbi:MAG TPA: histidine phosphatase family protein [Candidatus Binatia bacterium]|jgi:phosphohistidine phosphatase SixA|nr:histidine phosphatase family protein [Candidatus Udaeobacter sp.]